MAKRGVNARRQKSNDRSNDHHQAQDAEAIRQKSNDLSNVHHQEQDAEANFKNFTEGKPSYTKAEMDTYHKLHNKMLKQTQQKQRSNNHSN